MLALIASFRYAAFRLRAFSLELLPYVATSCFAHVNSNGVHLETTNGVGAHIWDVPMDKFARFMRVIFTHLSLSLLVYLFLSPSR
jgi:hypothetical protein